MIVTAPLTLWLLFLFGFIVPYRYVDADYFGSKRCAVFFLEVSCRSLYVLKSNIQKRNVAVSDQDIGKIGKIPECAEIEAGDAGEYSEGNYQKTQYTDYVDEYLIPRNTVCTDFCEGHKSQKAGEGKQAEKYGDKHLIISNLHPYSF